MKEYKIIVEDQNGKRHDLDLFPNQEIEIVYNIQDISEPDKRKISFVREFDIPGTKKNLKLFRPLFDNGYTVQQINPNVGMDAQLTNNNIVFSGRLQIVEVIQTDTVINFKVAIYSKLADFFNDIKGKKFNGNIDLSMFNHKLLIDKVEKSWSNIITRNEQEFKASNGVGYVYPMEDRGVGISVVGRNLVFEVDKWRPAIFIKTLVDRVFETYGFSYESEFFSSEYFKSLILPFSRDRLIPSNLGTDEKPRVDSGALIGFNGGGFQTIKTFTQTRDIKFPGFREFWNTAFNEPIKDPSNIWDTVSQSFTVLTAGKYKIVSQDQFNLNFNYDGTTNRKFYIRFRFFNMDPNNQPRVITRIRKNGVVIQENTSYYNIDGSVQRQDSASFTIKAGAEIIDYPLLVGDKIDVKYELFLPDGARSNNTRTTNIIWRSNAAPSRKNQVITFRRLRKAKSEDLSISLSMDEENEIGYGDIVQMNNVLPDITMEAFFRSLNKMFNLQWIPKSGNVVQIEPYNELFRQRDAKDWTYKVDRNVDKIITPMSELSALEYLFSYESDSDWANEEYELNSDKGFGARLISVENDFLEGQTSIIPNFSSTPLTTLEFGSSDGYLDAELEGLRLNEFVIPSYTRKDDSGNKTPIKPKTRILIWGGLVDSPSFDLRVLEKVNDNLTFNWLDQKTFTKYPYAGHLNSPIAPTEDLSYGTPSRFFHEWRTVTNNNLFNKYWRKWITSIVDPKSHMLTITMKMTDVDINNFRFNDIIQVDNSFYKVIKIVFNPINNIAVVNLLKSVEINEFTPVVGYRGLVGMKFASLALSQMQSGPPPGASSGNYNIQSEPTSSVGNYWIGNQLGQTSPTLFDYNLQAQGTQFPYQTQERQLYRQGEDYLPLVLPKDKRENGNVYPSSTLVRVRGFNNRVEGKPFGPIEVLGSNNVIGGGGDNIKVSGSFNFIGADLTNVSITGDGYRVTENNVTIINGVTIQHSRITQHIDLVEGSHNEVQHPYEIVKPIWAINGGLNSVINLGSDDVNDTLDGN